MKAEIVRTSGEEWRETIDEEDFQAHLRTVDYNEVSRRDKWIYPTPTEKLM